MKNENLKGSEIMNLLFYDFEVFKYYWCMVAFDSTTQEVTVIDNLEDLRTFYKSHRYDIWIGYNNKHYDDYILKGTLMGYDPKAINDYIMNGGQGWEFSRDINSIPLISYDVMVKRAGQFVGLKGIEYNMGDNIIECDVPFDLDRPLTDEEIETVIHYCKNDVGATAKVFLEFQSKFKAHFDLCVMYDLPLKFIGKSDANLTALILKAQKRGGYHISDQFNIRLPKELSLNKYKPIADWYLDSNNHDYTKSLTYEVAGLPIDFGWGGFHGAKTKYITEGFIVDTDVTSLYPSLMIEYGLLSRNIPREFKGLYEEIKKKRVELKKQRNPLQEALKLILNTTYGTLKDKNNAMFDPLMSNLVCLYGQLLMTDLLEKLEEGLGNHMEVIQVNTDGIFVKLSSKAVYDKYQAICQKWSDRTRLGLEHEEYVKMIQKDVNNYIAVKADGKLHKKGAYVKDLSKTDYELAIVNRAVVNYLVYGTPVMETIKGSNDLRDFQLVAKLSSNYDYLLHGDEKLHHRYYRIFASTNPNHKGVFKVKTGKNPTKIANSSPNTYIWNESVNGVPIPEWLDLNYYARLAYKRIEHYTGVNLDPLIEPKKPRRSKKKDEAIQVEVVTDKHILPPIRTPKAPLRERRKRVISE